MHDPKDQNIALRKYLIEDEEGLHDELAHIGAALRSTSDLAACTPEMQRPAA